MNSQELLREISDELKSNEWKNKRFNIFNALGVESRENSHSAFIANLLNPQGTHECANLFLRTFMDMLTKKYLDVEKITKKLADNVFVEVEKDLGNDSRVDIWIKKSNENYYLLIENKIDASDEPLQLLRYRNYLGRCEKVGKNTDGENRNGVLVYLTVNGKDADPTSTNGEIKKGEDYHTISYNKEIKGWLKFCVEMNLPSRVKSAIEQYLELIEYLTINIETSKKLLPKITDIAVIDKALKSKESKGEVKWILDYLRYSFKQKTN